MAARTGLRLVLTIVVLAAFLAAVAAAVHACWQPGPAAAAARIIPAPGDTAALLAEATAITRQAAGGQ